MNPQLPPMPPVMPPNPSLRRRLREGMRSTLALFQAGAFTLGGVGRHPLPVLPGSARRCAYTVREPDLIREVLVGRSAEFPKSILMDNMLRDIIGSSLFLANGETWRWRRAIVNPALQQARVTAVFERMREAGDAAVLRIGAASQAGPVRIDLEVTHFAADVIFRTIFSEPIDPRVAPRIIAAFETYQRLAYVHGLLEELHVPKVLRMGKGEKRRAAELIRSALKAPLDRRLALLRSGAPAPENDIAASLISQSDPVTGRSLNDAELLDEVAMLFLAGHETSASALAWALYLLATNPAIQERVLTEVEGKIGACAPQFGDMKKLVLTRNVFREALRLYPPVAVMPRDSVCPEQLADRKVEPGSVVFVTPWIMHRHERHWDNPNGFDPDRFEADSARTAIRQVYFPFSMGPRVCPGAAFALQEATLLLAMLVRRYRFEADDTHRPDPVARLTLRSDNGVRLRVTPRDGAASSSGRTLEACADLALR